MADEMQDSKLSVLRIDEQMRDAGCATLALCGALTREYVLDLTRMCDDLREAELAVTLNLSQLRSADREGLAFLLKAADASIRLAHCPPYIRRWIQQERRSRRASP